MPREPRSRRVTETDAGSHNTVPAPYTDENGQPVYHNPRHARCRGTGFLVEHYLVITEEGEVWKSRAWDCDCRPESLHRARFDRDCPALVGMSQDELDRAHARAIETVAEIEARESVMALPPGKRARRIMELMKPAPRPMPRVTVIA